MVPQAGAPAGVAGWGRVLGVLGLHKGDFTQTEGQAFSGANAAPR